MNRMRRQTTIFIVIILVLTTTIPLQATAADVGGRTISSKGACVIDFETGIVVYGYEADTQRVPASMTKLMSVLVVYDAIKAGEISLDTMVKISAGVSKLSYNLEYSNVPLPEGITVAVRDLLNAVMVCSACAAATALAEGICGSESAFVSRMNKKAGALGISASFSDSHGISSSNKITPAGMAALTRSLITDYPEVINISSKKEIMFRGLVYKNTNQLLNDYSGADGIKTGYTDAAGYCLTGTAKRDGRRIIAVTMGSTSASRFQDVQILLDYGFANAESVISVYMSKQIEEGPDEEDLAGSEPGGEPGSEPGDVTDAALGGEGETQPGGEAGEGSGETGTVTIYSSASPSSANLILNGKEMPLNAYLIGGSHYFKLRDVAFLMKGTECRFNVAWDNAAKSVVMTSGVNYPYTGNIQGEIGEDARACEPSTSRFFLDGVEYELEAYLIGGNNYFKLRELGDLFNFDVDWIGETRTVIIDTAQDVQNAA
ncbi:MAG: serine hydrolase [Oscillospiraceae bacterium]|nr:serine hydrolase [Oscillospiraceae bacterium]